MRRIMQAETVAVAKPAVHLNSGDKILAAETTALCRSLQCQGTAGTQGITELPRIAAGQVLSNDGVFNSVPSLVDFRKQQLKFQFLIVFFPRDSVDVPIGGVAVVTFYLFHAF